MNYKEAKKIVGCLGSIICLVVALFLSELLIICVVDQVLEKAEQSTIFIIQLVAWVVIFRFLVTLWGSWKERKAQAGQIPLSVIQSESVLQHYISKAEQGDVEAQYQVGLCLIHGSAGHTDYRAGLQCVRSAADAGHKDALRFIKGFDKEFKKQMFKV